MVRTDAEACNRFRQFSSGRPRCSKRRCYSTVATGTPPTKCWRLKSPRCELRVAEPPGTGPGVDSSSDADLRLLMRGALARLSARQRAVLVLRYFEDLPEADVARILGCSVGTARGSICHFPPCTPFGRRVLATCAVRPRVLRRDAGTQIVVCDGRLALNVYHCYVIVEE